MILSPTIVRTEYPLSPCNHEEFDTIIMLHAANAASQGYKRILILANNTDILGILSSPRLVQRNCGYHQEDEIYSHPQPLRCHITCKGTSSSCFSCPDRVRQHLLLFWHGKEISIWKVGHKARAHNCIVERPLTLFKVIERFIVYCTL